MEEILESIKKTNFLVGVAGPGAGKTYTFKQIIESNDFKGKKILILSFINKLIDDLKEDFRDFDNVEVSTLHSFAARSLGDVSLVEGIDDILTEDYRYLEDIKYNFSENLCLNKFSETDSKEAFDFYKERKKVYENNDKKIYSFNSSILAATLKYKSNENLIPEYDLILVDEFQDFNELEYELIKILNKKSKVVVVGDDDQSLYEFKSSKPSLIRNLYSNGEVKFSLDYCRRCPEVIVNSTNNLIKYSIENNKLQGRIDKKFIYPRGDNPKKDNISDENNSIDFVSGVQGSKLIFELDKKIKNDIGDSSGFKKRVLILSPKHYHQSLYEGLVKKGFHISGFELFSRERLKKSHTQIIEIYNNLSKAKTNNLYLRMALDLYFDNEEDIKTLLKESGSSKLWNKLDKSVKAKIECDINLFKKVKKGASPLSKDELLRLNELFNLKNILSKLIKGFDKIQKDSIEIEIITPMSSKGLSADYVYYIYVDDEELFGKEKNITDGKICEFLVGITRAKEKLTLFSKKQSNPVVLSMLDDKNINHINL